MRKTNNSPTKASKKSVNRTVNYGESLSPFHRFKKGAKGWNDRFVFDKVPDYDAIHDPHCIGFIGSLKKMRSVSRRKILRPLPTFTGPAAKFLKKEAKPKPARGQTALSNYSMVEPSKVLKISKKDITILKQALEDLWSKNSLREEHRTAFRKLIEKLNIHESAVAIVNEMEQIEKGTEPLQLLEKAVKAREETLEKINELADENNPEKIQDLLQKLRKETYSVINRLKKWRDKLGQQLEYAYQSENYLEKVREDYFALVKGRLSQWVDFEKEKADVLFMSPKVLHIDSAYFKQKLKTKDESIKLPLGKLALPKFVRIQKYFEKELGYKKTSEPTASPKICEAASEESLLVFSGLQVSEANFPDFIEGYLRKVPEFYVDTFGSSKVLAEKTMAGTDPKWFAINSHRSASLSEIKGLFGYCRDNTAPSEKRLTELLHVSAISELDLEKVMSEVINHIWQKTDSEEIHVKLYHKMVEGRSQCDETLSKVFQEKLGFKWVQLVNETDAIRYLVLSLSRPKSLSSTELQNASPRFFFKIGHFVALGREQDKEPIPAQKKQLFWGQGNLLSILSNLTVRKELVSQPVLHKLIDLSQNIKGPFPSTKLYNAHDLKQANSLLESQRIQLPPEICGSFTATPLCSIFSVLGGWTCSNMAQSKVTGANYPYIRVRQKNMVYFDDNKKGSLILVPNEEQQICLFFYKSGIYN